MATRSPIGWLRTIGIWEGISFLLLVFVCMPLKYMAGREIGVQIVGPIHGGLYVFYCAAIAWNRFGHGLAWKECWICFFAALLPFGPFLIDKRLERLDGGSEAN